MKRAASLFALLTVPFALSACPKDGELTAAQAQESLEEAQASSQAEGLTSATVDISTNFTIGEAVEQAAQDLKTFIGSQLPCADVSSSGSTLTVVYGAKAGNCVYRGHTFSGTSAITITKDDMNDVIVDHVWTKLSNGVIQLDGTAHVTWSASDKTRHITHDLTWTQLATGRTGEGTGDRTEQALAGGIAQGFQVDGSRSWKGSRGTWDLAIDGVQMQWTDPVPQAGTYSLSTPFDKTVSMSFNRVDADTIKVTVSGPKHEFSFNVSKAGAVSAQ